MGFREFLAQQEPTVREEEAQRKRRAERWVEAVESLVDQVIGWAAESDTNQILKMRKLVVARHERSLGVYHVPSLTMELGERVVRMEPITGDTLGPRSPGSKAATWLGRVDLVGSKTYRLYLGADAGGEPRWFALDEDSYAIDAFDRDFFDGAMVKLFS